MRTRFSSGRALTEGVVSSKVTSLVEGVLKMLLLSKLKRLTGGFLLLAAAVVAGWTAGTSTAPPP
jgi:hypothetical protein